MTSLTANTQPDDRPVKNTASAWSKYKGNVESTTSAATPSLVAKDEAPKLAWNPTLSLPAVVPKDLQARHAGSGRKRPLIVPKEKDSNSPLYDSGVRIASQKPAKRKRPESGPIFACPFLQHNPAAHDAGSVCRSAGFERLPDLKQHLFRRHAPLILCPTCHGQFSSFRDRDEHVGARICIPQEYRDLLEGHGRLTMEQSEQLRARGRYKDAHHGPAKRWRYIYTVIFPSTPEENIPSPYFHPDPHYDFKHHLRQRLPHLVASGPTGNGLAHLEDREEVVKWVNTCLDIAESEYQRPVNSDNQLGEHEAWADMSTSLIGVGEPFSVGKSHSPGQDFVDHVDLLEDDFSFLDDLDISESGNPATVGFMASSRSLLDIDDARASGSVDSAPPGSDGDTAPGQSAGIQRQDEDNDQEEALPVTL